MHPSGSRCARSTDILKQQAAIRIHLTTQHTSPKPADDKTHKKASEPINLTIINVEGSR